MKAKSSLNVVILDDCVLACSLIEHMLNQLGHASVVANDAAAAVELLAAATPDCILVDYQLPTTNGVDAIRWISAIDETEIPIVMVTGEGSESIAVEAMKSGAHDYIQKQELSEATLSRAIMHAVERVDTKRQLKKSNERIAKLADELMEANAQLSLASRKDVLTGLFNRAVLEETINAEHHRAVRHGRDYAFVMIDLDSFKTYNDTLGHQAGDDCLKHAANLIRDAIRTEDVATRYGGEEFAVLLPETDLVAATEIAERIRAAIESAQLSHPSSPVSEFVTASLGVASGPMPSWDQVIKAADDALYRSKERGRNQVSAATPASQAADFPAAA